MDWVNIYIYIYINLSLSLYPIMREYICIYTYIQRSKKYDVSKRSRCRGGVMDCVNIYIYIYIHHSLSSYPIMGGNMYDNELMTYTPVCRYASMIYHLSIGNRK